MSKVKYRLEDDNTTGLISDKTKFEQMKNYFQEKEEKLNKSIRRLTEVSLSCGIYSGITAVGLGLALMCDANNLGVLTESSAIGMGVVTGVSATTAIITDIIAKNKKNALNETKILRNRSETAIELIHKLERAQDIVNRNGTMSEMKSIIKPTHNNAEQSLNKKIIPDITFLDDPEECPEIHP